MTIQPLLPEMTVDGAERLSERISDRLDTIADNYVKVMPLIREAINRNVHAILGYASPGAYVKDRFGDALGKLGAELRREVVKELSNAGLTSRAIAPIIGVTDGRVRQITREVGNDYPPAAPDAIDRDVAEAEAATRPPIAHPITGEVLDDAVVTETHTVKIVTGLDGKQYTRPEPKPVVVGDAALKLNAETASKELGTALEVLSRFGNAAHRERIIGGWWPLGKGAVPPINRDLFNPAQLRQIAVSLEQLATEMESTNV
jgi:predicted transcriptional regulator